MTALTKILTGAAGLAALVGAASPAAAQYYPSPYGNSGGVLGSILNGVLGGGQYGYGQQGYGANQGYLVQQCARESERRIAMLGTGYGSPYGQYGQYGGGYGYNQYGAGARVVGITSVERKSYGFKVKGDATSGTNAYANPYGYGDPYGGQYGGQYGYQGQGYGQGDLSFRCNVDYRGQVTNLRIGRNNGYRG
jgi:hypothetical protein